LAWTILSRWQAAAGDFPRATVGGRGGGKAGSRGEQGHTATEVPRTIDGIRYGEGRWGLREVRCDDAGSFPGHRGLRATRRHRDRRVHHHAGHPPDAAPPAGPGCETVRRCGEDFDPGRGWRRDGLWEAPEQKTFLTFGARAGRALLFPDGTLPSSRRRPRWKGHDRQAKRTFEDRARPRRPSRLTRCSASTMRPRRACGGEGFPRSVGPPEIAPLTELRFSAGRAGGRPWVVRREGS